MDDVRSGKVEAIVVRDLSRFGRDYIEVGNYLEKIFPALGTRFISVKENFDNFTCGSSMESLSVSLQNLLTPCIPEIFPVRFPRRSWRSSKTEPFRAVTRLTGICGMKINPLM